uniref:Secreted protein n=1 Tax=Toxocara canis TaxID=6265 RepID=A0A183UJV5_TOXCA
LLLVINILQTFKATLSLTIVLEKSKRPVGSSIVRYDQYLYPFSDIIILSKSVRPLDDYRLITTAIDGTSTSQLRCYFFVFYCFIPTLQASLIDNILK